MAASRAIKTTFTGFVNQSQLPDYYLASDIVVLPSRRMGETWGLVINEALQAGCAAVVSDAVGCYEDFRSLERVRVFREGQGQDLTNAINELSGYTRDFEWAREHMRSYSIESAALAMSRLLNGAESPCSHLNSSRQGAC